MVAVEISDVDTHTVLCERTGQPSIAGLLQWKTTSKCYRLKHADNFRTLGKVINKVFPRTCDIAI